MRFKTWQNSDRLHGNLEIKKNIAELNEIFSTNPPPAKFPFNYYTASTLVTDPEVNNIQW